jgi:hypothetical protein
VVVAQGVWVEWVSLPARLFVCSLSRVCAKDFASMMGGAGGGMGGMDIASMVRECLDVRLLTCMCLCVYVSS